MATQTSLLHRLPSEIRLMIYQLVLCPNAGLDIRPHSDSQHKENCVIYGFSVDLSSSLLRACKLFHQEATHIFYSENVFGISNDGGIQLTITVVDTIGTINAASLRSICVHCTRGDLIFFSDRCLDGRNPVVKMCQNLPGLEEIFIWRSAEDMYPWNHNLVALQLRQQNVTTVLPSLLVPLSRTIHLLYVALLDTKEWPLRAVLARGRDDSYIRMGLKGRGRVLRSDVGSLCLLNNHQTDSLGYRSLNLRLLPTAEQPYLKHSTISCVENCDMQNNMRE